MATGNLYPEFHDSKQLRRDAGHSPQPSAPFVNLLGANRQRLLDESAKRLVEAASHQVRCDVLDELIGALRDIRRESTPQQWSEWIADCRRHRLLSLLHQDPFTRRAYEKPRGYAGDAELLDYIYGREELWAPPEATPLGRSLFEYTTRSPAPEGVCARRAVAAKLIDQACQSRRAPHVLAIAAGHLREAELSVAVKRRRVGRLLATDADSVSLHEVQRAYGPYGAETQTINVRRLFTRRVELGRFDLAYSTGLFDYLNAASGRRLVAILFESLNSGGRLMVANFLPHVRDAGYMEAFMDWNLVYRNRQEMMELTMEIAQEQLRDVRVYAEENENIVFLEIAKK